MDIPLQWIVVAVIHMVKYISVHKIISLGEFWFLVATDFRMQSCVSRELCAFCLQSTCMKQDNYQDILFSNFKYGNYIFRITVCLGTLILSIHKYFFIYSIVICMIHMFLFIVMN